MRTYDTLRLGIGYGSFDGACGTRPFTSLLCCHLICNWRVQRSYVRSYVVFVGRLFEGVLDFGQDTLTTFQ